MSTTAIKSPANIPVPSPEGADPTPEAKTAAPDPRAGEERRKHRRKKCLLAARLFTAGGASDCRVLDLSTGGAKIESSAVVAPQQYVALIVAPIGSFTGVVAWRSEGRFG